MRVAGRWDEEKVIQGLAILTCLAMVGVAVMPVLNVNGLFTWYACTHHNRLAAEGAVGLCC